MFVWSFDKALKKTNWKRSDWHDRTPSSTIDTHIDFIDRCEQVGGSINLEVQ